MNSLQLETNTSSDNEEDLRTEFLNLCDTLERTAKSVAVARQELGDDQTKELQQQIKNLELELTKKQRRRNNLLRQVRNYKALTATSITRGRQLKSGSIRCSLGRPKSRSVVIKQMEEYNQKHHDSNVDLALLILNGQTDYDTINSMMEPEQEAIGFNEVLARRRQIQHYRKETDDLTNEINGLHKEYVGLEEQQKQVMQGYTDQENQNNATQREYNQALIKLSRMKEEERMADELEQRAEVLQQEIDANTSDEEGRSERLQKARENAIAIQIKNELEEINKDIEKIKENNAELQRKVTDAELRSPKKSLNEEAIDEQLEEIKQKYNEDPAMNPKFNAFINQMESYALSPHDVQRKNEEKEALESQIRDLQNDIHRLETNEEQLQKESEPKRATIKQLENKLNNIAKTFDSEQIDQQHIMPEFTDGAPSIKFSRQDIAQIGADQTAIIVKFKEFQFERSFIGKKPSQVFLVVDLLEHQSMTSKPVDINSGNFASRMMFVCKNDFILTEYIENTSAAIQLCRQRDGRKLDAGWTELNLLPFLHGHTAMTQNIPLWNKDNKHIGSVTIEAAIYRAPKISAESI